MAEIWGIQKGKWKGTGYKCYNSQRDETSETTNPQHMPYHYRQESEVSTGGRLPAKLYRVLPLTDPVPLVTKQ